MSWLNVFASDCGGLSHPSNGVANIPYGTTYGENVIYTCYPGYQLLGNDTRVCTDTGVWSGTAPRCSIKGNTRYGEKVIHVTHIISFYYLIRNEIQENID